MQIIRTDSQNKRLYALLTQLNLLDMKANLALQYSTGRTAETSKLTVTECKHLIMFLDGQLQKKEQKHPEQQLIKRKRGKVLHLAIASGFKNEKGDIDYKRFNEFMLHKSVLKKQLKDYTVQELDNLITQFGQIAKKHK
jgi:hypothetical protein